MSFLIETIAIGDELLNGKVSDTNSTFVAERLFDRGFALNRKHVVADVESEMVDILRQVAGRCRVAFVFGGLGPTSDDKTAEVVARLLGSKIITHEPSKERMLAYYKLRNRPVNEASFKQVLYPEKTSPLANKEGMAPGFHCRLENCDLFFLPGVPREMKAMFDQEVIPQVEKIWATEKVGPAILAHTWKCLGIFESELQMLMNEEEKALGSKGWVGYRTHFPENHLALYVHANDAKAAETFEAFKTRIASKLAPYVFGENKATLEEIVIHRLRLSNLRLAVAESCTGGALAARLTTVPGSSDVFWGGVATYQLDAKKALLGVDVASPEAAVSELCSRNLALNLKDRSHVDITVGITGYMGPSGGTTDDPLGTVYICVQGTRRMEKKIILPPRSRKELQHGAVTYALDLVRQMLAE